MQEDLFAATEPDRVGYPRCPHNQEADQEVAVLEQQANRMP